MGDSLRVKRRIFMSTVKNKIRRKAQSASKASEREDAMLNRAGGVAFDIKNPSVKLITMTGGSFFMEPRYYTADSCIPQRSSDGKLGKLKRRLEVVNKKAASIIKVHDHDGLDDVATEIVATIWDVLESDNPKDALSIAHWLRREMNIRLTPQVILVLASHNPKSQPFVREYAPLVVQRADEVQTCIMLHRYFFGMKTIKNCLAQGLSDALSKFGERALLKYEGQAWPQWKDVLLMLPRKKGKPLNKALQEYFMFGGSLENGERLVNKSETPICWARKELSGRKNFDKTAQKLVVDSAANWEVVLSQFGQDSTSKRKVWEFLVENNLIGYMALLRNLRNMLSADVSTETIKKVAEQLSDAERVRNSKQLPFRFASAYTMLGGSFGGTSHGYMGWGWGGVDVPDTSSFNGKKVNLLLEAIENAADVATENVPILPGLTAIFADNSGSMGTPVSERSVVTCALAANVIAGIIAKRSEDARICAFGTDVAEINWTKNTHVLDFYKKLAKANTNGCSTNTWRCAEWLNEQKVKPDRVIILSDMQVWDSGYRGSSFYGGSRSFCDAWGKFKRGSKDSWLHCVNLNGYGDSMVPEGDDKVNLVGSFSEKVISMLLSTEGLVNEQLPTLDQIRENW